MPTIAELLIDRINKAYPEFEQVCADIGNFLSSIANSECARNFALLMTDDDFWHAYKVKMYEDERERLEAELSSYDRSSRNHQRAVRVLQEAARYRQSLAISDNLHRNAVRNDIDRCEDEIYELRSKTKE